MIRQVRWLWAALLFTACASEPAVIPDQDAGPADSGTPDGGINHVTPPADPVPPAAPAPPVLTPCRPGWTAIPQVETPTICSPWPNGEQPCAPFEAHFPGTPACQTVGSACPSTDWPAELPADRPVLYVRPGAPGDGTKSNPHGTIMEAIAVAPTGAVIALAKGSYDEPVTLADEAALWGACAAETVVAYSVRDDAPASIVVAGPNVAIKNLQVAGARSGVLIDDLGGAVIEGVIIDHATETGLRVHHTGTATVSEIIIRDTITDPDDGLSTYAVVVEAGGTARVHRAIVERHAQVAVIASEANSHLILEDAVVRDTACSSGDLGVGLAVQLDAAMDARGVVLENNHYAGVLVAGGSQNRFNIEDSIVRDTWSDENGAAGNGLSIVGAGNRLTARRTLIERSTMAGLVVSVAEMELSDLVVRDAYDPSPEARDSLSGLGLYAIGRARVNGSRLWFEHNADIGIAFYDRGTVGTLADITAIDHYGTSRVTQAGWGLSVAQGAAVDVERALFAKNEVAGIFVPEGGNLTLLDVVVRETEEHENVGLGYGIKVRQSEVEIHRAHLDRNKVHGLWAAAPGTVVRGSDILITDTRTQQIPAHELEGLGVGLFINAGADVTLQRARVEDSRGFGVYINGSLARFEDLQVVRTQPFERAPIFQSLYGNGLEVFGQSQVELTRGLIEENHNNGITAAESGTRLTLRDVEIRKTLADQLHLDSGRGLVTFLGACVDGERIRMTQNREISMFAHGPGTTVNLSHIAVIDTLKNSCAETTCPETAGGIGVGSYDSASITLVDFRVSRAALCGVQVGGGDIDLNRGEVSHSPVGANIQDPSYDFQRLSNDVVWLNNGTNLDATAIPVPKTPELVNLPVDP